MESTMYHKVITCKDGNIGNTEVLEHLGTEPAYSTLQAYLEMKSF
jgi:hypothetical protein